MYSLIIIVRGKFFEVILRKPTWTQKSLIIPCSAGKRFNINAEQSGGMEIFMDMEFLDQIKQTVTDAASSVAQKSSEMLEVSKIRYAMHDLKGDIKKLYTEIGRLCYDERANGIDHTEEITIKCDIVQVKKAKIDALQNKEKQIRQEMVCPICGKEVNKKTQYCTYCGSDLAVEVEAEFKGQYETTNDSADVTIQISEEE